MQQLAIVLPTARAIRHEQLLHQDETLFLPHYLTMGDFLSKLCLVDGYASIDDEMRTLLLLEASKFQNFEKLQIERNFFTFMKNSSYIISFFKELSVEKYDIANLKGADLYGEYEEHIEILEQLYHNYEKLCDEKALLDPIFLPKKYSFNKEYLAAFERVEIYVDGYLSNFELELLQKASECTKIVLHFKVGHFNAKMKERLTELGFELKNNHNYTLDLNSKEILQQSLLVHNKNVSYTSVSESLLEIAFVKQKVYEYIQKGYAPHKIAVVLPNEQTAELLRLFDTKGNFNFAMGESFSKSTIYQKLDAAVMAISQKSHENFSRLERVGESVYEKLLPIFGADVSKSGIFALLESFCDEISSSEELRIYKQELLRFEQIAEAMKQMSVKSFLSLFLSRLSKATLNDVRGGEITVMGVLETRSVAFDGVIIVDFDERNVPRKSDKDMFLNTQIRKNAALPTMQDREELQKHYYEMLLDAAKEVSIVYVQTEQNAPSRFLKQLKIQQALPYDEKELSKILFATTKAPEYLKREIVLPYSFENVKISPSRLKTFLSCKRRYYYNYIVGLKEHTIPKDMPQEYEIGNNVHEALKHLYLKKPSYSDVDELQRDLEYELEQVQGSSELDRFLIALQKRKLREFCVMEVERFKQGWEVLYCEKSFEVELDGMILCGNIDRVDKRGNEIVVLDYKTGSYKLYTKNNLSEAVDFQLEFYYLLTASLSGDISCAFYDLKEMKIVDEMFLEQKLELLNAHLSELKTLKEVDFVMCEDEKECLYCPYGSICQRV